MDSVVLELQREALNRKVHVSDLLRKALVVARKLGLKEFEEWTARELSGYMETKDVPEYRVVHGQVRGWNPYHGWIPVLFSDPKDGERLSRRACGQSIAECESLIDQWDDRSSLQIPLPQEIQQKLSIGFGFQTEVTLITQYTELIRILDTVRTIVLNWSLKLEEDGVLGEGLTFTPAEKQVAEKHSYNINNFYGPVQNPQIQQEANQAMQVTVPSLPDGPAIQAFLSELKTALTNMSLSSESGAELRAEIETVETQLSSPKPKPTIIRECFSSMRRLLEGAGGGAAAHLLVELGKLLM